MLQKRSKLGELIEARSGLPKCPVHKKEELEWICLEKVCPRRLFCSYCVIQEHSAVHKQFASIYDMLDDPLSACLRLGIKKFENIHEPDKRLSSSSYKEKIDEVAKREESKLADLFLSFINELQSCFNQLRRRFRADIDLYLEKHKETFEKLEERKTHYIDLVKQMNVEEEKTLIEGLETLLEKFLNDEDMHKAFEEVWYCLPGVKHDNKYDVQISGRRLENMSWTFFMDKILRLPGVQPITFDTDRTCGDVEFSADKRSARKKGGALPSTTISSFKFSGPGTHSFQLKIEHHNGSYICLGVINSKHNIVHNADQYAMAHCVCSDNTVYNMVMVNGNINIVAGDVLTFNLNYEENYFEAVGHNNKFVYRFRGISPNDEFYVFMGFSARADIKVSFVA